MKQVLAAQLAEWIDNNAWGTTRRDGINIYIEGGIDAYDLLVYVQSLLAKRTTAQIQEDNYISYTGRSDLDRARIVPLNAVVEGADYVFVED